MTELRILAHFVSAVAFAYLFFDDLAGGRRTRPWLWCVLCVDRLLVMAGLVTDLIWIGSWVANRWILTPTTIAIAVTGSWYAWRQWYLKRQVRQAPAGADEGDGPPGLPLALI